MWISRPKYFEIYNCIILFIIGYLKIEKMFTYYLPIVWSTQPSEEEGILNEILFKKIDKIFTHISSFLFGTIIVFIIISFVLNHRTKIYLLFDTIVSFVMLIIYDNGQPSFFSLCLKVGCLCYYLIFMTNKYSTNRQLIISVVCVIDAMCSMFENHSNGIYFNEIYSFGYIIDLFIIILCEIHVGLFISNKFRSPVKQSGIYIKQEPID